MCVLRYTEIKDNHRNATPNPKLKYLGTSWFGLLLIVSM